MRLLDEMSDKALEIELKNFERHRVSKNSRMRAAFEKNIARYESLLVERQKRAKLKFEVSLAAVAEAASVGSFLSYGDIATANGLEWSFAVRMAMPSHLWDLVCWSHERNLPMISAIIVNKTHLQTGEMEPETLKGFVSAAEGLGYSVSEPAEFLRLQQIAVFEYFSGDANESTN